MKLKIFYVLMVMSIICYGCDIIKNTDVVSDTAITVGSTTYLLNSYENVNRIIFTNLHKFKKAEQDTIIIVSKKFEKIKADINTKTSNTDILMIKNKINIYIELYTNIVDDYLNVRSIIVNNIDKFGDDDITSLNNFDLHVKLLYNQILDMKKNINNKTDVNIDDIKLVMSNLKILLKSLSNIIPPK